MTKDILAPLAFTAGAAGVGVGLYFVLKKPPGVDPGDSFTAKGSVEYRGPGGTYDLQVCLGRWYSLGAGSYFDEVGTLKWRTSFFASTSLPPYPEGGGFVLIPLELECPIPTDAAKKTYDAEITIRRDGISPDGMGATRLIKRKAVTIREREE